MLQVRSMSNGRYSVSSCCAMFQTRHCTGVALPPSVQADSWKQSPPASCALMGLTDRCPHGNRWRNCCPRSGTRSNTLGQNPCTWRRQCPARDTQPRALTETTADAPWLICCNSRMARREPLFQKNNPALRDARVSSLRLVRSHCQR